MPASHTNKRNLKPLKITIMIIAAPFLFIFGLIVGNFTSSVSISLDSLSYLITAIATVAIATLTFVLAVETWRLREAQSNQLKELKRENIRPNISIQLENSHVGMNFVNVKISNLGKGIAKKVVIRFLDNADNIIPLNSNDPIVEKFRKLAIFRQGIQSMGIGQKISSFVFSFIDLSKELDGDIFTPCLNIVVDFEDIEGTPYQNAFTIDFAQYEGLQELGSGDPTHQIAEEIKKIREKLGVIAGNAKGRMSVDIFSAKDRDTELERTKQNIEMQKNRMNNLGQ